MASNSSKIPVGSVVVPKRASNERVAYQIDRNGGIVVEGKAVMNSPGFQRQLKAAARLFKKG